MARQGTAQALPSHETMVANIVDTFNRATAQDMVNGTAWYREAHDFCAALAGGTAYSLEQIIAVVAILSPNTPWGTNKAFAVRMIEAHTRGDATPPAVQFPANRAKAWSVLNGGNPDDYCKGIKVEAFRANITGEHNRVTVDLWHYDVATGTHLAKNEKVGAPANRAITAATLEAAELLNVAPSTLQAVCWVVVRGKHD